MQNSYAQNVPASVTANGPAAVAAWQARQAQYLAKRESFAALGALGAPQVLGR